jgi:disulfide bond formation protein DsbB
MRFTASQVALFAGSVALSLILGALAFQYIGGYPPCEMCHWQRWPHIAAAAIGLVGFLLLQTGLLDRSLALPLAVLAIALIAASGALGIYHAGVEWHFWPGPAACTSSYVPGQVVDLTHFGRVPLCDRAAWRLLGISMAGYNALISLGTAALAAFALVRRTP